MERFMNGQDAILTLPDCGHLLRTEVIGRVPMDMARQLALAGKKCSECNGTPLSKTQWMVHVIKTKDVAIACECRLSVAAADRIDA